MKRIDADVVYNENDGLWAPDVSALAEAAGDAGLYGDDAWAEAARLRGLLARHTEEEARAAYLAHLGYEQHRGCLVLLTLDGATVHRDGKHIGDFREPRIGAVASAYEWGHSVPDAGAALAAVESALTERYAATLDPVWLSARIRTAAGLD